MNPDLTDPHNHVPEVSPDDMWGDAESSHCGTTVLPPKRPKTDAPGGQPGSRVGEGLRIESNLQRIRTDDPEDRLQVQEIDGSVVRLSPETATTPRMERHLTFHERPARSDASGFRQGELHEWGRASRHSVRWILGTGLGVASLVILAMMLLPAINKTNAARPDQMGGLVMEPVEQIQNLDALQTLFARQAEAEQVFRAYAAARIADDVVSLVRGEESMKPLLRSRFHALGIPKDWNPPSDNSWSVAGENGGIYGILEGTLPDFSSFRAYMIQHGEYLRLDWKATTGFGTASFDEMESGQGDVSEIRAMIAPTGFFNAAFPEDAYHSYQLISPDKQKAIWCYTRKEDPVDATIATLFQDGIILQGNTDPVRITLRLERGPAEALPNQWLIREMLHKDWIKP